MAHPDHKVVTVLATNGEPITSLCQSNTLPDIAAVAGLYFKSTPSIPTYVIGGPRTFADQELKCGQSTPTACLCDGGATTQNSHATLLARAGAATCN